MKTACTIFILGCAVALAAVAGWRWWTAPPSAPGTDLTHRLGWIPAPVDGGIVLAQPTRAARWLQRRPQAAAPLLLTSPPGEDSRSRLEPLVRAMAWNARGPLAIWWRGGDLAVAAELSPGARRAVIELADLRGLPWQDRAGRLAVATDPALLSDQPLPPPPVAAGRWAALVVTGERVWRVRATRDSLSAVFGAGAAPPPELPPVSRFATPDAGRWLVPLGVARRESGFPICAAFGAGSGWGVSFSEEVLHPRIARLLGAPREVLELPEGAEVRWRGVLGRLRSRRADGRLALASRQELLSNLQAPQCTGEWGAIKGEDLVFLAERLGAAGEFLLTGSRLQRTLAEMIAHGRQLRAVSWQIDPEGGWVTVEW